MKSKFISLILAIAVVLAMVAVPATVSQVAASGGVTVAIDPTPQYALPGSSFTIDAVVNNPLNNEVAMHAVRLDFDPTYFTVDSVSLVDFTTDMAAPAIDNVNGHIGYDPCMPTGTSINKTTIISARISCTANSLEGVTPVSWVFTMGPPPRLTKVTYAATDYLEGGNMSLMLDGSVIIGSPSLTVDVSPGLKGDVEINGVAPGSYPDVSSWGWDEVVDLEAIDSVAGWAFDSWSGDLGGSTNPTTITMDSLTMSVTANFLELSPSIGLSPNSLSFVTYEGVNPADQSFDITNEGGQTLSWAIEPRPTWEVGDWWLLYNYYWDGVNGTAAPNNITMSVTGTSGCNYMGAVDFVPAAQRTIEGGMPAIMHNATVLVDQRTLDYVQQVANIDIYLGDWTPVIATVSWVYFADHGWPYSPGKMWSYNVTQAVTYLGSPVMPPSTTTAYAVVSDFTSVATTAGTFDCWEITHCLNPGDIPGTTFMQTYWSDEAQSFVQQWDAGTYDYPPLDIRSLLAYSSTPPAGMPSWLSATPTTGALVGNGASETVTVSVDAAGLTVGNYAGVITVTDPCASSATVDVDLQVKPATYIPSERNLPGTGAFEVYAGDTFDVYVNFTSSAVGLNSIGLTDVAPDGWIVQANKVWCTPAAYAVQVWGNEVEILWSGPYNVVGTTFSAMYKVTVPVTAKPGINTWEVCPDMDEASLSYYFGEDGPHAACISGENQMVVIIPGDVIGETRDVNAAPLGDVDVTLNKVAVGAVDSDASTPNYSNTAYTTGMYWQVATKALYYTINMTGMVVLAPNPIDLSTPALLAAGKVFDFEGNYGLVPRACTLSYAMKSVNLWLYPPALNYDIYGTVIDSWGISEWKALDSIHSWQFPRGID